ncbi:MAG: permease [Flavobacteriaceae bacterium]|nr:permease [Flavobacteriaceae bacterium]|tara:strand:- start:32906 stop:33703 length:798 start_codon:yes stop_codon:yes gene_type:complete
MEVVEIFGYVGALLIGLVLGLIGGGGSILTVPIFVYALGLNPVLATAYSLFVVGITSLVGAIKNMVKGKVDLKTAFIFAIPAFIAVYVTRAFLIPVLPTNLFEFQGWVITKNVAIMLFFAIIMILAAISMIRDKNVERESNKPPSYKYPFIVLEGFLVGVITGIVGAGGGFLIIPALVLFAKLPMKKAVATSLLIIAIKSLIGFIGDLQNFIIDWPFLITFSGLSIVGIFAGIWLTNFIDGKKLKKAFGWFVLIMAGYIIYKELL